MVYKVTGAWWEEENEIRWHTVTLASTQHSELSELKNDECYYAARGNIRKR